jgi:hypothetical protein
VATTFELSPEGIDWVEFRLPNVFDPDHTLVPDNLAKFAVIHELGGTLELLSEGSREVVVCNAENVFVPDHVFIPDNLAKLVVTHELGGT